MTRKYVIEEFAKQVRAHAGMHVTLTTLIEITNIDFL